MITVYVDVLICINIIITYIFLVCVRVFLKTPTAKVGVAIASIIGGLSSLLIYLDSLNVALSVLLKVTVGAIIVFTAFIPRNFKLFLKQVVVFSGISFLFAGIMFALELTVHSEKMLFLNGTVYFDMDLKYLIGSVFVIYGMFLAFDYFLGKVYSSKEIYSVCLGLRNTEIIIKGFVDTGNNLQDGVSGRLVAVSDIQSVSPLFTAEEIDFFQNEAIENIPSGLRGRFRIIPCKTVGDTQLLYGFIPDKAVIDGKESRGICVAISKEKIASDSYDILLNKKMLE